MSKPIKSEPWHVQRPPSAVDCQRTLCRGSTTGGSLGADIDLRVEIEQILNLRGHKVFLRRAMDRRCGCWDKVLRESNPNCPHCTGTGWLYKDELHLARRMPLASPGGVAAMAEQRTPIGIFGVDLSLWWFKYDVKPATRDCILEVTLNPETGEPVQAYNIERIWNINSTHDYRDKYGRIEYWACWCKMGRLGKE